MIYCFFIFFNSRYYYVNNEIFYEEDNENDFKVNKLDFELFFLGGEVVILVKFYLFKGKCYFIFLVIKDGIFIY